MCLLLKMKIYTILGAKEIGVTNSHGRVVDVVDFEEVIGDEIAVAGNVLIWIGIRVVDFADFVVINKFDKIGALDALRDVKKQYQRNHQLFDSEIDAMPVYGTISSEFNNSGLNQFYYDLVDELRSLQSFISQLEEQQTFSSLGEKIDE